MRDTTGNLFADYEAQRDRIKAELNKRMPQTPLMSVADVASVFNVSNNVVYHWIECGEVFAVNMAGGRNKTYYKITTDSVRDKIERLANGM